MPDRIWVKWIADARDRPAKARAVALATAMAATDPVVLVDAADAADCVPRGRPAQRAARETGRALLEVAEEPAHRVLARWGLTIAATSDDLVESMRQLDAAVVDAAGDDLLEAWIRYKAARFFRRAHRWEDALAHIRAADRLLEVEPTGLGPFSALPPIWAEVRSVPYFTRVLRVYISLELARAERVAGSAGRWFDALERAEAGARAMIHERPSLLPLALGATAQMQRALGHPAPLDAWDELVARDPKWELGRLRQIAFNEAAAGDHEQAARTHLRHLRGQLQRFLPHVAEAEYADIAEAASREDEDIRRRRLNRAANAALDAGRQFMLAGTAWTDPEIRRTVLDLFAIADAVWCDWGTNGPHAVRFRRAYLEGGDGAMEAMLGVARGGIEPGLRISAITAATTVALPEQQGEVLATIDALLTEQWWPQRRGSLLALRAWLHRPDGDRPEDSAAEDALRGLNLGAARRKLFRIDAIRAHHTLGQVAAAQAKDASARGRLADAEASLARAREHYSAAAMRVAEEMLVVTPDGRSSPEGRYLTSVLGEALDIAVVDPVDPLLADRVSEVVRRDDVFVLLERIDHDPEAPGAVRDILRRFRTAVASDDPVPPPDESPSDAPEAEDDESAPDSRDIDRELERANAAEMSKVGDEVQQLLGAVASLTDPTTLDTVSAARVIRGRATLDPTYLLQLLPFTSRAGGVVTKRVLRRLTYRTAEGMVERVDTIERPHHLVSTADREGPELHGDDLIPADLAAALCAATYDDPIRLIVVPTGFFHLHWDALRSEGQPLIYRALVTVSTSLTIALHLLDERRRSEQRSGSIAVVDPTLPGAVMEAEALRRTFPICSIVGSKEELERALDADRAEILALGVHGVAGVTPWSQQKRLADGEFLTVGELFDHRFPPLCVLASCYSSVRGEGTQPVEGLPVALTARGAETIVGAVSSIPDRATGEILAGFYAHLRSDPDPVRALRRARLQWIEAAPARVRDAEPSWGRLVIYNGLRY